MRLDPMAPPDPADSSAAHAHLPGQGARAPMCGPSRLGLEGSLDYLVDLLRMRDHDIVTFFPQRSVYWHYRG